MKLLTVARDLKRRKARERQHRCVAEGIRAVEVLFESRLPVVGVLTTRSIRNEDRGTALLAKAAERQIPIVEVSEADFASAANTDTPQGVLAVADSPTHALARPGDRARYLALDALQDPGNVGTIIRSAAAFGVTAIIALPGTVDLWNAKVVRSAMGAHFTLPAVAQSFDDFGAFAMANDIRCWAGDTTGISLDQLTRHQPHRLALIVSNEGAGLSENISTLVTQRISIPMAPGVESLNVAVATGILLHEFCRVERSAGANLPVQAY